MIEQKIGGFFKRFSLRNNKPPPSAKSDAKSTTKTEKTINVILTSYPPSPPETPPPHLPPPPAPATDKYLKRKSYAGSPFHHTRDLGKRTSLLMVSPPLVESELTARRTRSANNLHQQISLALEKHSPATPVGRSARSPLRKESRDLVVWTSSSSSTSSCSEGEEVENQTESRIYAAWEKEQRYLHRMLQPRDKKYLYRLPSHGAHRVLVVGGCGRWIEDMRLRLLQADFCGVGEFPHCKAALSSYHQFKKLTLKDNVITGYKLPNIGGGRVDIAIQRGYFYRLQTRAWPVVLREYANVLNPNGLLYLVEMQLGFLPLPPTPQVSRLQWLLEKALEAVGINADWLMQMRVALQEAGFVDMEIKRVRVPVGAWGGVRGKACRHWLQAVTQRLVRTVDEDKRVFEAAMDECEKRQMWMEAVFWVAKRPATPVPVTFTTSTPVSTATTTTILRKI